MKKYFLILAFILFLIIITIIYVNRDDCNDKFSFNIKGEDTGPKIEVEVLKNDVLLNNFRVDKIASNARAIQKTKCYLYVVRDFSTNIQNDPYRLRYEMWRYDLSGNGSFLTILLHTNNILGSHDYSHETIISSRDRFIALSRFDPNDPHLNSEDALVIKKLKNLSDYYEIPLQSIYETAKTQGDLQLIGWSEDSRYLWFRLSEAALTNAFGRVDVKKKSFETYKAPDGTMGGDMLNLENGWVTYRPESFWCGAEDCTEYERNKRIKQGRSSDMYVYNLFTGKKHLIVSIKEDPIWYYKPRWISETELQYIMPSGAIMIFNVSE